MRIRLSRARSIAAACSRTSGPCRLRSTPIWSATIRAANSSVYFPALSMVGRRMITWWATPARTHCLGSPATISSQAVAPGTTSPAAPVQILSTVAPVLMRFLAVSARHRSNAFLTPLRLLKCSTSSTTPTGPVTSIFSMAEPIVTFWAAGSNATRLPVAQAMITPWAAQATTLSVAAVVSTSCSAIQP